MISSPFPKKEIFLTIVLSFLLAKMIIADAWILQMKSQYLVFSLLIISANVILLAVWYIQSRQGNRYDVLHPYCLLPCIFLIFYNTGLLLLFSSPHFAIHIKVKAIQLLLIGILSCYTGIFAGKFLLLSAAKATSGNTPRAEPMTGISIKIIICFWIFGLILLLYYLKITNFPMLNIDTVENSRHLVLRGKGPIYWPAVGFIVIASSLYFLYLIHENKLFTKNPDRRLYICLLLLSFIEIQLTGWRSPMVTIIGLNLTIFSILVGFRSLKKAVSIFLMLLFIISAIGVYRTGKEAASFERIIVHSYYRIGYNLNNFATIYNHFRNKPPLYGKSFFHDLGKIVKKTEGFDFYLKRILNLQYRGGGYNPTLFGDLYINFKTEGIILLSFLLGLFYSMIYFYLKNGPLQYGIRVYTLFFILFMLTTSTRAGGISGISLQFTMYLFALAAIVATNTVLIRR